MSKVQIAAKRLIEARKFAEANDLAPNQWVFIGSAMALRARKPGIIYVVTGLDPDTEKELAIWSHFKDGKVHRVDASEKVKFDG